MGEQILMELESQQVNMERIRDLDKKGRNADDSTDEKSIDAQEQLGRWNKNHQVLQELQELTKSHPCKNSGDEIRSPDSFIAVCKEFSQDIKERRVDPESEECK